MNIIDLPEDSKDYHILFNAAASISGVPGAVCEIGTRRGGSTKHIIDGLLSVSDFGRNVICIDPYGNIEYAARDNITARFDYTNDMRNETITNIYQYILGKPINLVLLCLEDTEFFNRFSDGFPFYQEYKTIINEYSLVFFDGPHDFVSIDKEVDFFLPRSVIGTKFVFDDVEFYDHNRIHDKVISNNFVEVERGWKASYVKVK